MKTQIFTIAKSRLIDLLRKNALQSRTLQQFKETIPIHDETLSSSITKKETYERIFALVDKMPPVRKQVFKLSREAGFSNKEIAEQLSLTSKNVENHIAKALRQLRKALLIYYSLLTLVVARLLD